MDTQEVNVTEKEEKIGYRDIFKQTEYMKIIISNVIGRFGDSIDSIAFTWLVYAVTGSAAWSAIIFALNQLPTVLLQPFAGVMVEKMNKKRVMVISDLVRGCVIVLLVWLYATNNINPLVLALFTLIISSVEAFCLPASIALIPKVIDMKYYAFGTSVNSTFSNVAQLIGLGIAGVIINVGGIEAAMLINGVTFFLSAVLTGLVKYKEEKQKGNSVVENGYFKELKDGINYIKVKKVILNFCILAVIMNAVTVPINSLQSPMAVEIFGLGSELLSVFGVTLIIGMTLGTLVLPYIIGKVPVRAMVIVSGVFISIGYGALVLGKFTYGKVIPSLLLCGGISLVLGAAISLISGAVQIQFMNSVEEEYLARAASIFNASASAASPIMSMIVSALAVKLSVGTIFLGAAICMLIVFMIIAISKMQME